MYLYKEHLQAVSETLSLLKQAQYDLTKCRDGNPRNYKVEAALAEAVESAQLSRNDAIRKLIVELTKLLIL
jgi:hypothetical protein